MPLHVIMLLLLHLWQSSRPVVLAFHYLRRYGLVEDSEDSDEELLSSDEDPESDMPAGKRPAKGSSARPATRQIDEDAAMEAGGCPDWADSEPFLSGYRKSFQAISDAVDLVQGRWPWHPCGQAGLPRCDVLPS